MLFCLLRCVFLCYRMSWVGLGWVGLSFSPLNLSLFSGGDTNTQERVEGLLSPQSVPVPYCQREPVGNAFGYFDTLFGVGLFSQIKLS